MSYQLDTSGTVWDGVTDPGEPRAYFLWFDLSPFVQGYVEAMFGESCLAALDEYGRPLGFSDLDPATLARIIADCERALGLAHLNLGAAYNANDAGGHCFWSDQQAGLLTKNGLPALTVSLNDAGKVVFS